MGRESVKNIIEVKGDVDECYITIDNIYSSEQHKGVYRKYGTIGFMPTANPDVANDLGMVTLNGGDVTHVTITFDGNGGNLKGNQAVTATYQDIVTATNSLITRPEFERLGYTFLEWNTRPDGKGTTPPVDNIMNTSSNITYYAIWIPGVGN